jgi:DNA-binding winged helix-turn-helix (wHTH) protein
MEPVPMRYIFGDYCLDTQCYELHRSSVLIPLRPKIYQILVYLLRHYDRVVLKHELLEHVWPGQSVGDAALHSYIMDIRKVLGDVGNGQHVLRTLRGRGYRFIAPVEVQGPVRSASPLPIVQAAVYDSLPPMLAAAPLSAAVPIARSTPCADGEYKLVTILCGGLDEAPPLAEIFSG